jgi:HEAT repeat protein
MRPSAHQLRWGYSTVSDFEWLRDPTDPKSDTRPIQVLIATALSKPDEELTYWNAVAALQWRGTLEVFNRADRLCQSPCSVERRLGADILGQLGCPDRSFPKECTQVLLKILKREENKKVLCAILVALSHHQAPEAIGPVSRFRHHANDEVRFGVVMALKGYDVPDAEAVLIELTRDANADVRDWATFALGTLHETDTPAIRDALADRLADIDIDTRCEALVGLARRRDQRALPSLHRELSGESVSPLAIEAATLIAIPQLIKELIALRGRWDGDTSLLEQAIQACLPDPCLGVSGASEKGVLAHPEGGHG